MTVNHAGKTGWECVEILTWRARGGVAFPLQVEAEWGQAMGMRVRRPRAKSAAPFVIPPNIPTFDCDDIVHIEHMGDRLKLYLAGPVPVSRNGSVGKRQEVHVAVIWNLATIAPNVRKVQTAAALIELLAPADDMGEVKGHG